MASRSLHSEACAAIRTLLASIPPAHASAQQRADFQVRKAEVFDLIAAVDPYAAAGARDLACRARFAAESALREH